MPGDRFRPTLSAVSFPTVRANFYPIFTHNHAADLGRTSMHLGDRGSPHLLNKRRHFWTTVDVARRCFGGEGGIRTPDTVTRMPHFECGAFNHSATSPTRCKQMDFAYVAWARDARLPPFCYPS